MTTQELKIKSIELALQLPDNSITYNNSPFKGTHGTEYIVNTTTTLKKTTDNLILDAEKILNFLTLNK